MTTTTTTTTTTQNTTTTSSSSNSSSSSSSSLQHYFRSRSKQHNKQHSSTTKQLWSTSNDWNIKIPKLTSNDCYIALENFFHHTDNVNTTQNSLLALATEASSHPSGLSTLFAQPYVYAGGGLGNIQECPATALLQTCLAGGTKRDSLTFASTCIVSECTALDLASDDFVSILELAAGPIDTRSELARSYIQLHSTIYELNKFLKTGWTCGEYKVEFMLWPFGLPYLVILCGVVVLSIVASCGSKKKKKRAGSKVVPRQQENYYNYQHQEEKKEQGTPPAYSDGALLVRKIAAAAQDDTHGNITDNEDTQNKSTIILQAFNVHVQMEKLTLHRPATAALDGLRVMSILWVILGHVMAIQSSSGGGYNNPKDFLPPEGLTTKLGGQLLFASRFAVDTFLILSGYLVVHVLLSKFPVTESSPSPSRFHFVSKYFQTIPGLLLHRILRIMPLYAMCLGFWTQVAPHLGGGPFWYQWEPLLESCRRFGWTNLLFVNNFFPWNLANTETCFYHSWYLAVDVQLFVLAPLLVSWYRQNKRTGQLATGLLLLLSVVMTMYLSFARKWSLNTFDGAAVARFDVEGYAKPHVRAQSYLSGMLLAMWLDASSNDRLWARTPSWKHRTAMGFALASLAFVTFCTVTGAYSRRACRYEEWPFLDECGSTWSPLATFLYAAISRAVWALAIVVIMTLCLNQQGGSVGDFLSWKGWTPLSNLSFGVYLVHPIVIFVWQLGGTQKETFRLLVFGMNYISVCVVSFAASLLLSLLVELPCATLVSQYGRRFFSSLWNPRLASRAKDEDLIQLLAANRSIEIGERPSYHYGSVGATSHSDTTHR